jgi:CDP-glycerol glycerophosphotransferase
MAAMLEAAGAILGWVFAWPFTLLVGRDDNLVVFWGRDGGKFLDNCKYLYVATRLQKPWLRAEFLGIVPRADDIRRAAGGVRGLRAKWLWLRAGTIVVDSVDWQRGMRFAGSRGARIVQLWHGVPLKQVQLGRVEARRPMRPAWETAAFRVYLSVVGRLAKVDWFLSTGRAITERAFSSSFRFAHVSHAGYPRNDVLLREPLPLELAGVDLAAMDAVAAQKRQGGRVMLYAPTFREGFPDPFAPGGVDLAGMARGARAAGMLLLVKLHPWMRGKSISQAPDGALFVAADSDIYPILRDVDVLVTDYSSVYFDFLLLDRPVLFFPYDLGAYVGGDRPLYFDYDAVTPGPRFSSMDALTAAMPEAISADCWREARARVRAFAFDHADAHASKRLLDELFPTGPSFPQG